MELYEISERIGKVKLFSSLSDEERNALISPPSRTVAFEEGLDISESTKGACAVLLSGRAEVFSKDEGRHTLIRVLSAGDVFGVAGLFSGAEKVSRIITTTRSSLLIIPKESIICAVQSNQAFAVAYFSFLEKRIAFLNQRIAAFTAGKSERKLAIFLCSLSDEEAFEVSGVPFSSLAKQLDIGRASLYRAIATLEEDGLIRAGAKSIEVLSRASLRQKYTK